MKIYFAGSIRGGRDDKDLYAEIIKLLSNYGEVLTEHVGDKNLTSFGEDGPSEKYIYDRDMAWLKDCDAVIAEVTTPSLGVGYEVAKAEEWNKRVLCIYREVEGKRVSAMITGSERLQIKKYSGINDLRQTFNEYFEVGVRRKFG